MPSTKLNCLLSLVGLALLGGLGCGAPRRPPSLDFVPDWTAETMDCKRAEYFTRATFTDFKAGKKLTKYSDCYMIVIALMKFDAAGGPCPSAEFEHKVDKDAFGAWFSPCNQIMQDAAAYQSSFADYQAREGVHRLSWRDSLTVLGAAALLGGNR